MTNIIIIIFYRAFLLPLKIFCALCIHLFSPVPIPSHIPDLFCCLYRLFFREPYSWNHTLFNLFRLFYPLTNVHLRFLHVFHGSDLIFLYNWIIFYCLGIPLYHHSLIPFSNKMNHSLFEKWLIVWLRKKLQDKPGSSRV